MSSRVRYDPDPIAAQAAAAQAQAQAQAQDQAHAQAQAQAQAQVQQATQDTASQNAGESSANTQPADHSSGEMAEDQEDQHSGTVVRHHVQKSSSNPAEATDSPTSDLMYERGDGRRDGAADGAHAESARLFDDSHTELDVADPRTVTETALKLKYLIEEVIPVEVEEELVTKALSPVITEKVIAAAQQAADKRHRECIVYCLIVCKKWFIRLGKIELWDADLHDVRAQACEVIAKRIIESYPDEGRLLKNVLLQRYSTIIGSNNEFSPPANAVERAVDLHALRIIGSSGYQQCIKYLWLGWVVQDDEDPTLFVFYDDRVNESFSVHFDPDRMRVPKYQNALQILISLAYLALYTGAINTINPTGDLDLVEGLLYLFTAGFLLDEAIKIYKVGRWAVGFWTVFNVLLYSFLVISFITRMIALAYPNSDDDHETRKRYNQLSYNFLAVTAPMFWTRLIFYLDNFKFFGAMLVVFKNMMTESLIFFAVLSFQLIGFFQAFLGLDLVDESLDKTSFIVQAMANAIMSSPDFSGFENFAPPFGISLFYLFSFIVMVILLNILIALYNSSYEAVSSNANDEYLALFAQKTLNFVRAPDEHVFIPPLNLIEIFGLVIPFEWWLPNRYYDALSYAVMFVIYAPLLVITALVEKRDARTIAWNRRRGEADDDTIEEWEVTGWDPAKIEWNNEPMAGHAFIQNVKDAKPDLGVDVAGTVKGMAATVAKVAGATERMEAMVENIGHDLE